jgi:PIN domain nuclease of toxin-antitoxin system
MEYLADTVTIVRYFSKMGNIGKQARQILHGVTHGEHHLFISTLSLVEILYLSEKARIEISLDETLKIISESENFSVINLTPQIVKLAEQITFPDIFDRLIISTAKYLDNPILTSDKQIQNTDFVETIWN